jgi:monofunctional biosynthetic peptidoglycan transglycosylase
MRLPHRRSAEERSAVHILSAAVACRHPHRSPAHPHAHLCRRRPCLGAMLERYVTGTRGVQHWRPIESRLRPAQGGGDHERGRTVLSALGRRSGAALREEIENMLAGRNSRGASTISMQVARNLFPPTGNRASARRSRSRWPSSRHGALQAADHGDLPQYRRMGCDGESVSRRGKGGFGVDAGALSWEQASLLAVTLPNRSAQSPDQPAGSADRAHRRGRAIEYWRAGRMRCRSGKSSLEWAQPSGKVSIRPPIPRQPCLLPPVTGRGGTLLKTSNDYGSANARPRR